MLDATEQLFSERRGLLRSITAPFLLITNDPQGLVLDASIAMLMTLRKCERGCSDDYLRLRVRERIVATHFLGTFGKKARRSAFSPRERQVIELRIAGHGFTAISGILGIDSKSVDNTIQRAKKKMLQNLAACGDPFGEEDGSLVAAAA